MQTLFFTLKRVVNDQWKMYYDDPKSSHEGPRSCNPLSRFESRNFWTTLGQERTVNENDVFTEALSSTVNCFQSRMVSMFTDREYKKETATSELEFTLEEQRYTECMVSFQRKIWSEDMERVGDVQRAMAKVDEQLSAKAFSSAFEAITKVAQKLVNSFGVEGALNRLSDWLLMEEKRPGGASLHGLYIGFERLLGGGGSGSKLTADEPKSGRVDFRWWFFVLMVVLAIATIAVLTYVNWAAIVLFF